MLNTQFLNYNTRSALAAKVPRSFFAMCSQRHPSSSVYVRGPQRAQYDTSCTVLSSHLGPLACRLWQSRVAVAAAVDSAGAGQGLSRPCAARGVAVSAGRRHGEVSDCWAAQEEGAPFPQHQVYRALFQDVVVLQCVLVLHLCVIEDEPLLVRREVLPSLQPNSVSGSWRPHRKRMALCGEQGALLRQVHSHNRG